MKMRFTSVAFLLFLSSPLFSMNNNSSPRREKTKILERLSSLEVQRLYNLQANTKKKEDSDEDKEIAKLRRKLTGKEYSPRSVPKVDELFELTKKPKKERTLKDEQRIAALEAALKYYKTQKEVEEIKNSIEKVNDEEKKVRARMLFLKTKSSGLLQYDVTKKSRDGHLGTSVKSDGTVLHHSPHPMRRDPMRRTRAHTIATTSTRHGSAIGLRRDHTSKKKESGKKKESEKKKEPGKKKKSKKKKG